MKFVVGESQRHQSVYVQQIGHGKADRDSVVLNWADYGKLARISSTSLLLSAGASGPAVSTGRPVTASVTILAGRRRCLRGVSTMRPDSTSTSRGSPARSPSRRRRGPGSTTW